jgi:phosphatidyl-myo-inositol dimannoside synthase
MTRKNRLSPPSVLLVAFQVAGGGGIERLLRAYTSALAAGGACVSTLSLITDGVSGRKSVFVGRTLARALREQPRHLILGHVALAPLIPAVRLLSPRTEIALLVYGQEVWTDSRGARTRVGLRRAHRLLAVSDYTANSLARWDLEVPVRVLRPPAPPPRSIERPTGGEMVTILAVSRLETAETDKHVDWLIAAMARARRQGRACILRVVGDGSDIGRLRSLAAALEVQEAVRFLGRVSDTELDREYRTADVFALPSVQEGFGLVYLEAMTYGLPVVAARARAVPEVVTDGETGLLMEPGELDDLSAALIKLVDDPHLRHDLGRRGRLQSQARFSASRFDEAVAREFSLAGSEGGT